MKPCRLRSMLGRLERSAAAAAAATAGWAASPLAIASFNSPLSLMQVEPFIVKSKHLPGLRSWFFFHRTITHQLPKHLLFCYISCRYEPFIVKSKNLPGMLFCALTGELLNARLNEVRGALCTLVRMGSATSFGKACSCGRGSC